MIQIRTATVLRILAEPEGVQELAVRIDGDAVEARAIAYPAMTGAVATGSRVTLNTTAVALGLGSGGWHFVMAVDGGTGDALDGPGHVMKLRYTPSQVRVLAVEEDASPDRAKIPTDGSLHGTPVVWIPLHSMLGPVAAGAVVAGAERVVYVMTDGAALPAAFSRIARTLRHAELLRSVISAGQAFGGDLESVNVFSGLLAAHGVAGADVIVVGDGPGNTGTRSPWGATNVASAMALNAAGILHGRAVAALRVSFADERPEHRGVSHHSITALSRVALLPVHVALPAIEDDQHRLAVWEALRDAGLEERHQLIETNGVPAIELLAERGIEVTSMGRSVADDPEYFLAAGAAGVLAGRMAARDRGWRDRMDPAP